MAACLGVLAAGAAGEELPAPIAISIDSASAGKPISTELIGIFFEDINHAADGGLYAELVQNRSFEYSRADNRSFRPLTAWTLTSAGPDTATLDVVSDRPLNANNPHYAQLAVNVAAVGRTLVANEGFGGMSVRAGEPYAFSLFTRQLEGSLKFSAVQLRSSNGDVLAEALLPPPGDAWAKQSVSLKPNRDEANAKLVLVADGTGRLDFDMVSLFPQNTFRGRPNGLRADLAQTIADLRPRFVRFPGGCVAHGRTLANMYHWKDTIGPVEERKSKNNLWGYHQGYGLGYFEYFQFCQDIGATPVPVVAAGVSCQFGPGGQQAIPMADMPAYVQDVLDLIEWANGPATSTWGAKRAAAGHPEPFNLKYIGVGNEDAITPAFTERLKMIRDAVSEKHPEIVLIGTSGPFHSGPDFDRGWAVSRELGLTLVDEHYYVPPAWLLSNTDRYDTYERNGMRVYVGEYAAHDDGRRRTLRAALAEAAYLTGLERNADVVQFASYAPLLGKVGGTQWDPNLIYFDNSRVFPTLSYEVQKLFGNNGGDRFIPTDVHGETPAAEIGTQIALGTWGTQAEFDDVRITANGQTVFADDFSDTADDANPPHWRAIGGRWGVTAGQTLGQSDGGRPALNWLVPTFESQHYTLSLRARKTGGDEGFLIGFGGVDDRNYYWLNLGGWGNSQHGVEKSEHGSKSMLGRPTRGSIETGRWYDIRIEVAGHAVKCFLDDQLVQEFFDDGFRPIKSVFASTVRDSATGELILKLVNARPTAQPLRILLNSDVEPTGTRTILTGDPLAENGPDVSRPVLPVTDTIPVDRTFDYVMPAHSFSVIRLRPAGN